MVAALDLLVRVPPSPVVARPQPVEDGVALLLEPLHQAVRGDLVLDPRPHLVAVPRRHRRPTAVGPRAHQQTGVRTVRIHPVRVHEVLEAALEVVPHHRAQGGADVLLGQDVSEVEGVRPPLPDQLVGEAAALPLELARVAVVEHLDIVFAGEELLVIGDAAALEPVPPAGRNLVVPPQPGHLLPRAQRR